MKGRKSWAMAYCGMAAALSIAFMLLGAVIPILMYIAPAIASFLVATVCVECGKTLAWTAYGAVSLLSLLFVPDKEVALTFVFLLGYYPLVKPKFEHIRPALLRGLCKLLLCNGGILLMYGLVLLLIPGGALAFFTGAMMLVRASEMASALSVVGLTLAACGMFAAGLFLLYRALVAVTTCPWISEEGVRAGIGVYMPWEDVHFGYVHRRAQVSGMFLLSQPLEKAGKHGEQAVYCLSLPDTSTLLLAYLTYCPYAEKGISV